MDRARHLVDAVRVRAVRWDVVAVVAWGALVAFVLVGVGTSLLGLTTFLATDMLGLHAPWSASDLGGAEVTNRLVADTVDAVTPRTLLITEAAARGDLAQWNPYVVGGTAAAPLPDGANFSPLSLPWWVFPATYAPGAVKVLEVLAIAVGMSLLLRRLGLRPAAWAVASLVFASSGFMIAWTNWAQTRVAALIPLLFWAVERAVTERRWRDLAPVALVVAAMVAGGFPAVTGYALYAAVAYGIVRVLAQGWDLRRFLRAAGVVAAGVVTGVALTAWQVLPFVHQTLNVIDFEARAQDPASHLDLDPLATTVVGGVLGGTGPRIWGSVLHPVEYFSYLGVAAVLLVLVALVERPLGRRGRGVRTYALVGLALSLVLLFVGGPVLGLFQVLPIFSDNFVGRLLVLVGFFAALAAAIGFDRILAARSPAGAGDAAPEDRARASTTARSWTTRLRAVLAYVLVVGVAGGLAVVVLGALDDTPSPWYRETWQLIAAAAAAGLVALVLIVLVRWRRTPAWRVAAGVGLPVIIVAQALVVVDDWWPASPVESFYPETETHEFLAENLGHDRFITVGQTMMPGTSTAYGLRAANGHAFTAPEWKVLLETADPLVMRSATMSSLRGQDLAAEMSSPILDRMATRYVALAPDLVLPGRTEQLGDRSGTTGLEDGLPAEAAVAGPVRGVVVEHGAMQVQPDGAVVTVRLVDADGTTVAETARLVRGEREAGRLWFALTAEELGQQEEATVEVSATGLASRVDLVGEGEVALEVVRPEDDGFRVAHTGDATVVERLTSAPRLRWATEEVVEADAAARVALLHSGEVPASTVVLEAPEDARGATGEAGQITVDEDGTDTIEVTVDAEGGGWLVVADSVRAGGWSARIDGEETELVPADHAMGAVWVPEGQHEVRVFYEAPGMKVGLVISAVATAGVVLLLGMPVVFSRGRRRPAPGEE